jgi:hypothetical protein
MHLGLPTRFHLHQLIQQGPAAAVQLGTDHLRSDPDRCIHLSNATANIELLYQLGPPANLHPVNVMRRSDESTVPPQRVVTQLDYAKIGPDFGPNAQDLPEKVWPWAFRHGLCEEQRHRGRRPRHPCVAMHEEVRICLCRQPAPER